MSLIQFMTGLFVGRALAGTEECVEETPMERRARRKKERRAAERLDVFLNWFATAPKGEVSDDMKRPDGAGMNRWGVAFCWAVIIWGLYSSWRLYSVGHT